MRARNEKLAVRALGNEMGFGRVAQLALELWRELLAEDGLEGGEFSLGPCVASMVPCVHPVLDANGHCEVCCGAGFVTKWVAANLPATAPSPESLTSTRSRS